MRIKVRDLLIPIIIVVVIGAGIYFLSSVKSLKIGSVGSAHEHADFKVYINGEAIYFSQPKYMIKNRYIHVENMNGNFVHKHATGVTLGYFFETLGMKFNDNCFVLDNGNSYCNEGDRTLKFYVNGVKNSEYGDYEIRDLDKYLISYGDDPEGEIQGQLNSVTNFAIYEK